MKKIAFAFALLLAALTLVACGGGDDDTTGETAAQGDTTAEEKTGGDEAEGGTAGSGAVAIEADPGGSLAFTTDSATAKAGKVTVDFTNSSPVPHDADVEETGGKTLIDTEVLAEGSDSGSGNLNAGEYTFFCSVPGHREAGMEGSLTVE